MMLMLDPAINDSFICLCKGSKLQVGRSCRIEAKTQGAQGSSTAAGPESQILSYIPNVSAEDMEGAGDQSWPICRRQEGRTRRRKRSDPRDDRDQVNIKRANERSPLHFNVEIPHYYDEVSEAIRWEDIPKHDIPRQSHTESGEAEKSLGGIEKNSQDEHNVTESAFKDHQKFVIALEKFGSKTGAWEAMASELKWTVEELKVYAYSYFKSLTSERNSQKVASQLRGQGTKVAGRSRQQLSWSFQELVLLDSLMLKYCRGLKCLDVKETSLAKDGAHALIPLATEWEKIAAQLPGKNALACKEMGISRLLGWYNEKEETLDEP
ncbi:hypothetical protein ACHAWF_004491 [Thalassiosira exigua]